MWQVVVGGLEAGRCGNQSDSRKDKKPAYGASIAATAADGRSSRQEENIYFHWQHAPVRGERERKRRRSRRRTRTPVTSVQYTVTRLLPARKHSEQAAHENTCAFVRDRVRSRFSGLIFWKQKIFFYQKLRVTLQCAEKWLASMCHEGPEDIGLLRFDQGGVMCNGDWCTFYQRCVECVLIV